MWAPKIKHLPAHPSSPPLGISLPSPLPPGLTERKVADTRLEEISVKIDMGVVLDTTGGKCRGEGYLQGWVGLLRWVEPCRPIAPKCVPPPCASARFGQAELNLACTFTGQGSLSWSPRAPVGCHPSPKGFPMRSEMLASPSRLAQVTFGFKKQT